MLGFQCDILYQYLYRIYAMMIRYRAESSVELEIKVVLLFSKPLEMTKLTNIINK